VSAREPLRVATLAGQIRRALLSVTFAAILVATVAALAVGSHFLLAQTQAHLRALATLTASHSEAALVFKDRDAAEEVLRGIPPEEGVIVAELRDASGRVVARIAREDTTLPGAAMRALVHESETANVVVDGRRLGSVTLESSGEPLVRALVGLLAFDLLGALFVCLMVFAVERRLTGHVTRPLNELEAVVRSARENRDFTRRAEPCGIAEIEALRTDFHGLLDEIRRRDEDLGRTHAALKRLAFRDALTGLANRAMLESALLAALGGEGQGGERTGLLYFDVDSFKTVNDALGHATGDALLKAIASRLRDALPAHAMPARIGGDEFVVLVSPVGSEEELRALAAKVDRALHAPLPIGRHVFHPGLSIGHAVSGGESMQGAELLELADRAMYLSKQQRRSAGDRTRWEAVRAEAVEDAR
jgi:diguanylate cyclase (GGDEF)-like protein